VELKDGRLGLVYSRFGKEGTDFSSADLAMRTSSDGGETWSDAQPLLAGDEAQVNVMSVSILRLANGELLLFYLRVNSRIDANLYVRRSTDELHTLSDPTRVTVQDGYNVVTNDRVIQTSSGRIIVPANLHTEFDAQGKNISEDYQSLAVPFVYFSDDDGRTWKKDSTPILPIPKRTKALQENGVVELGDGRLWMFMRTYHFYQYGCFSSDNGVTWTTPEPTSLASPLSPATIKRIPWTGDLLCVWNDHSGTHPFPKEKQRNERTPLCIATSSDEGQTWSKSRILENNPNGFFCYTAMTFHQNRVLLAYMARDSSKTKKLSLKVVALSKDWIYSHD
ncbi:MAG: sialidase family protein, partial [Pirellulaceae bacterium]